MMVVWTKMLAVKIKVDAYFYTMKALSKYRVIPIVN